MNCAGCGNEIFLQMEQPVMTPKGEMHDGCAVLAGVKTEKASPLILPQPQKTPIVSEAPLKVRYDGVATFPIVLDEHRRVEVPTAFTEDDLEYVFGVLDLYVKRRAKLKAPPLSP